MHRPLAEWDPHASQSSDRGWRPHQEASQETQYATACCGRGASCPHLLLYCAVVRAGWPRWQETLLHVSDSLAHNKFVLLLLIICPVIYFDVIQLCAPCPLPVAHPFAPDCNPGVRAVVSSATTLKRSLLTSLGMSSDLAILTSFSWTT